MIGNILDFGDMHSKESIYCIIDFLKCFGCSCNVHARYIAIMCYLHNSKVRFTRLYY